MFHDLILSVLYCFAILSTAVLSVSVWVNVHLYKDRLLWIQRYVVVKKALQDIETELIKAIASPSQTISVIADNNAPPPKDTLN